MTRQGTLLALVVTAASASAADVTVQNDSGLPFTRCACFLAGEQVAAWLTSPCHGTISEVHIGWFSAFGLEPDTIEMEIHLYRAGVFPSPGVEITSGELVAPTLVDGMINELDASPVNATVTNGEIIVSSLEFLNQSIQPNGVAPVYDQDGCQATKNTVFVLPGGWFNACALGVTGDWVIRLVIDCNPCPWDCGDGDGDVDVVDFFALIGEWGMVGTPCDFGLGIAGVDVVDFFELIAKWGPCPP